MLDAIVKKMLNSSSGAIEAPAGTGKTEQIALIAGFVPGRWLILTHTVAGVDAIRRRLGRYNVPPEKFQVDTISAWSYRWARAYPNRSGLANGWSAKDRNWDAVIVAATQLVKSGAIPSILAASYDGVLVDEYQDCSKLHHNLVESLSHQLPCYVFGDPLQAIFNFGRDSLIDWNTGTLNTFPLAGTLETPHRWNAARNPALGNWLITQRANFKAGQFDFRSAPSCLTWSPCAAKQGAQHLSANCDVRISDRQTLAIIHSSVDEVRRADLAKALRATTVESVGGASERAFYESLRNLTGVERADAVLTLMGGAYTQVKVAEKKDRIHRLLNNPSRIRTPPTPAELALCAVSNDNSLSSILDAINCIEAEAGVSNARPELMYRIKSALRLSSEHSELTLDDAAWQIITTQRDKARIRRNRTVGSTLLVKGLEFDHVVITPDACSSRQNWYVALTRATTSVRVLSPSISFST